MHKAPARYLILIDSGGAMVARLFDGEHTHVMDIDASSEEVAVMTAGLEPARDADTMDWERALRGHSAAERQAALVYTLDV